MSIPLSQRASLRDFEPLLPAERIVLRAAAAGEIAKIGYRRPRPLAPELQVRAELLAFLARGGGDGAPVAARSLQVMGACVTGRIDLAGATLPLSLWLYRCSLVAVPRFDGARVRGSLSFADCALPGLRAEGCRIDGELALSAGCRVDGDVRLTRTRIGGDLNCERLHLGGSGDAARGLFVADAMRIGGSVNLLGGAEVVGELRFVGAQIGGDLRAGNARLTADIDPAGTRGVALNLDRACIGGSVALDAGFSASGAVRLEQVEILGDLDCSGADFDAVGDASWGEGGAGLTLARARVGGRLALQRLQTPLQGASLIDAQVGSLLDDASTWGLHHVLDGFGYTRLGTGAPTDPAMRLDWLRRQRADHLDADFRPEPWWQLIGVLQRMGHDPSARAIAIGRERQLRRIGAIGRGAPRGLRWLARLGHGLFGLVAGYGHRPMRTLMAMFVLWLACAGAYWAAAEQGALAPTQSAVARQPTAASLRPLSYSLDVMLPLIDLREQQRWVPVLKPGDPVGPGALVQALSWFEAACGWLAVLTLLAVATGLTDRDRRR